MALTYISEITTTYANSDTNGWNYVYANKDKIIGQHRYTYNTYGVPKFIEFKRVNGAIVGAGSPTWTDVGSLYQLANGITQTFNDSIEGLSFIFNTTYGTLPRMYRYNNAQGNMSSINLSATTQWAATYKEMAHNEFDNMFGFLMGSGSAIYFSNWNYDGTFACNNYARTPQTDFSEGGFVTCYYLSMLPGGFVLFGSASNSCQYIYKINGSTLTPISNPRGSNAIWNKLQNMNYVKVIDSTHILLQDTGDSTLKLYEINTSTGICTEISSISYFNYTLWNNILRYNYTERICGWNITSNTLTVKVFYIKGNVLYSTSDSLTDATYVPAMTKVMVTNDGYLYAMDEDSGVGNTYPNRIRLYSTGFEPIINPAPQSALFLSTIF